MILCKRIIRSLRRGLFKYISIFLIVVLSMAIVVGYGNTSFSTKATMSQYWERTNVEDGEFVTYTPLKDSDKEAIEALGIQLEETFYFDVDLEDDITLRVFKLRKDINLVDINEEQEIEINNNDVIVEKLFLSDNAMSVGDQIEINNKQLTIAGSGTVPDYCHRVADISDVGTDEKFGLVFTNEDNFTELLNKNTNNLVYNYTYTSRDEQSVDDLFDYLTEMSVSKEDITDTYILGKIKEIEDVKIGIKDGIIELREGTEKISDSLESINKMSGGLPGIDEFKKAIETMDGGISNFESELSNFTDEYLNWDYPNLYNFQKAESNTRIVDFIEYHEMFFMIAIMAGVLLALMIAFIFSVFALNNLEEDRKIIGTLFALGYRKTELLRLYIALPIMVVSIGAILGSLIGFKITEFFITANYSRPEMISTYPPVLLAYGIIMPIAFSFIINYSVLSKKLNKNALDIMRNEKINTIRKAPVIKVNNFIGMFRVKHLIREFRSNVILLFGISLSIIIMMLGISLYGSIVHYSESVGDDIKYEYMYNLKNPLPELVDRTEVAFTKKFSMYCEMAGKDMPVVLQGVETTNKFFEFSELLKEDENLVYVSDSAVVKFGYEIGDKVIFTDEINNKDYTFTVAGTVSYKNGIYFFMNSDAMQSYFSVDEDYYNTLLTNEELDIDNNMVISNITKSSILETAESWVTDTIGTIGVFIIMSIIIFVLVTYLLVKHMIDKAEYSVSLMKILGFYPKEINKMYLGNTVYVVIISLIITLPLGTRLMEYLIPLLNASMKSGMKSYIDPKQYLIIILLVIVSYLGTSLFLKYKLSHISLEEILKERE